MVIAWLSLFVPPESVPGRVSVHFTTLVHKTNGQKLSSLITGQKLFIMITNCFDKLCKHLRLAYMRMRMNTLLFIGGDGNGHDFVEWG